MLDGFEDWMGALGQALAAPSLGQGELALALLVALAFLTSAVRTWLGGGADEDRRQPRF